MKILNWVSLLDKRKKLALSLVTVAAYIVLASVAPLQASFAVVVIGFIPIILISLAYGWRAGGLFGILIPIISTAAALLRADPLVSMDRRLIGIISGGMLGAIIGIIRDQWMALINNDTVLDKRIEEETRALQKQN